MPNSGQLPANTWHSHNEAKNNRQPGEKESHHGHGKHNALDIGSEVPMVSAVDGHVSSSKDECEKAYGGEAAAELAPRVRRTD